MKPHKKSYQFSRRSFLSSVGGAAGFVAMLKNVEGQAAGATSPPRLLVTHHPVGTIRNEWLPSGSGTGFTFSRILSVFEPVRERIIIIDGLSHNQPGAVGGGHEAGTVLMMTGTRTTLTRGGQPETDDPPADGPSADQLFLSKSAVLQEPPIQSLQAICDDRIDAEEVSTRTLSYSLQRQTVQGVNGSGQENIPMRPQLSPLAMFQQVFGGFVPGEGTDDAVARALQGKKSVLDYSLRELAQLRALAPASQWDKLDAHEIAIREVEREITAEVPDGCAAPEPPDASLVGAEDDGRDKRNDYNRDTVTTSDHELHRQVAEAHLSIIRGALACDLTRVVTFQFSPGTNHVSFQGMNPENANGIYMHHPISHRLGGEDIDAPASSRRWEVEFLIRIEEWYNQRMLEFLTSMQSTQDVYGGSLLDFTIVPYLTEVARATHERNLVPTVIFGGQALGLQGGQFITANNRNHVDMWLAVAQALGISVDDLSGEKILSGNYQGPLPVLA